MTASAPADAAPLRPVIHIRPTRGWLNDPNGVVRHAGRWHVFFQHNPERAEHGSIHWGHVSSPDLVRWTEHPVAFGPTAGGPDRAGCWTGVHVPGSDPPAMVYSGIIDETFASTVCLREALDEDLVTWSDPVVVATTPEGVGVDVMRDPFVFAWQGRRWALLGAGLSDGTPAALLYSCDDLRAWRFERIWLTGADPTFASVGRAEIWECPQLVQVDGSWTLVLSLVTDRRLGDVVYLLGDLVDQDAMPAFAARSAGLLDAGTHFYAPQVAGEGREALMFGWVRQESTGTDTPPNGHEQVGCLSLPRRLGLDESGRLRTWVDPGLEAVLQPATAGVADLAVGPVELPSPARIHVRPAGVDQTTVRLVAPDVLLTIPLGPAGADIWLDADVAEVYGGEGPPCTLRASAAGAWSLEGTALVDLSVAAVAASTLEDAQRERSAGAPPEPRRT